MYYEKLHKVQLLNKYLEIMM